jgi:hypothetical protein
VVFGDVEIDTSATQSITLAVTGNEAVTLNAAVTGAGFSLSGVDFPVALSEGQTVTLEVAFRPTVAGPVTGQLTVTTSSPCSGTGTVSLSGTGGLPVVDLTWTAPASSTDPIAGYNVYRSSAGGASYLLLNASPVAGVTYLDSDVQPGQAWDYCVRSIDEKGAESGPSNTISVSIP